MKAWLNNNRISVADSYFASVPSVMEMLRNNIIFIGVLKTSTQLFMMLYISALDLNIGGYYKLVVSYI